MVTNRIIIDNPAQISSSEQGKLFEEVDVQ